MQRPPSYHPPDMGITLPTEPSAAMLNLSALVYLLGITIITWCIARTTENYCLCSRESLRTMPWPRLCLLLTFVDSWLYLFLTGMMLQGAAPEHHVSRCSLGMLACILLYGASKGLIYLCLIERVHVVWSDGMPRWKSPIYRFCFALVLPLGIIAGIMIFQRTAFVYNGYCIIGISRFSSLLLLTYDFCINTFLTVMFIIPLLRSSIRSAWLRAIAVRTTVAACVALLVSAANVVVLYVLDGQEMIWVCFGACGVDVVINAVVLLWAMQGPSPSSPSRNPSIRFAPTPHSARTQQGFNVDTLEMGSVHKVPDVYPPAMFDYAQSRENFLSQGMTVSSSVCIPSLEEPEPALRSPRQQAQFGQHPWGNRSPLPTTEPTPKRSDSQHTCVSLTEENMAVKAARESGYYVSDYEFVTASRRSSSVTPTPPSQ
ncbi:hypothetical protein BDV93DRAFT_556657 [Ceratobasidium sp. AG-I]|nr:hypothetical protein BDV93DRAFT_556657 [Ceratobasidium sp. AG-I]